MKQFRPLTIQDARDMGVSRVAKDADPSSLWGFMSRAGRPRKLPKDHKKALERLAGTEAWHRAPTSQRRWVLKYLAAR